MDREIAKERAMRYMDSVRAEDLQEVLKILWAYTQK